MLTIHCRPRFLLVPRAYKYVCALAANPTTVRAAVPTGNRQKASPSSSLICVTNDERGVSGTMLAHDSTAPPPSALHPHPHLHCTARAPQARSGTGDLGGGAGQGRAGGGGRRVSQICCRLAWTARTARHAGHARGGLAHAKLHLGIRRDMVSPLYNGNPSPVEDPRSCRAVEDRHPVRKQWAKREQEKKTPRRRRSAVVFVARAMRFLRK